MAEKFQLVMVFVILLLTIICIEMSRRNNKDPTGNIIVSIPKGSGRVVIVGIFTKSQICLCDRIPPLLTGLKRTIPDVHVALLVSNYSFVDKRIFNLHPKIIIHKVPALHKYDEFQKIINRHYAPGIRYGHYYNFLVEHPEFREIMVCDDDTLILRDPFDLFARHPNDIHIMRDIFDFTVHNDFNYRWFKAWQDLDPALKIQFGLKTKLVLSEADFEHTIPLNSGFMIAKRSQFMKIVKLMSVYNNLYQKNPWLSDQGLLNWMMLTGQLTDANLTLFTYGVMDEIV